MLGAIKYNLSNLANFTGRDARQTFWYYVLFLVVLQVAVSMASTIPMMIDSMGQAFEAARAGVSPEQMNAQMMAGMGGYMQTTIWLGMVMGLAMALLLVAAFVRRLHDSDHSGWWAALPFVTQLISIGVSYSMADDMIAAMSMASDTAKFEAAMAQQQAITAYGMIGWIGPIVIIVFGIMKSTDGPNRFGDAPVRF